MNKTFKVVFNKARGVMTVVNEATSSVQAKGCKAVVAAACVLAASYATAEVTVTPTQGAGAYIAGVESSITEAAKDKVQISASEHDGYLTITAQSFESSSTKGAVTNLGMPAGQGGDTEFGQVKIWGGEFVGNKSQNSAGALAVFNAPNTGDNLDHEIRDVKFINNTSESYGGGAIAFHPQKDALTDLNGQTTVLGSIFQGNEANNGNGGAMFIEGTKVIVGNSIFGGANSETETLGNSTTGRGGAIFVNAGSQLVINDGTQDAHTLFEGNSAGDQGGAIFNGGKTDTSVIGNWTAFIGNTSTIAGGAISNNTSPATYESASLQIKDNVLFQDNSSKMGGAIFNQRDVMTIGTGVSFIGNKTTTTDTTGTGGADAGSGGAIMNQAETYMGSVYKASLTIGENASFSQNSAERNGGAIANYAWRDNKTFINDSANVVLTFEGAVAFNNNAAKVNGGAIYNDGTINFNGNATFSGNTAGGVLNDIHNDGTVNVNAGTLTLDGGITGNGTLNFADNSSLAVTIGSSQETSTTITNNVIVGENVNLSMIFNPGYEGDYTLLAEKGTLEGNFIVDNVIYNITAEVDEAEQQTGAFTIEKKTVSEIAESAGVTTNQAAALNAITSKGTSTNTTYSAVAEQINTMIQSGDAAQMQAAADAVTAMSPEAAPMVSQVQTDTAAQVFNVIGSRLGSSQGMASGDGTSGTGLWVQGMVGTTDLDDTSKARGYSADTTGLALGLEAKPSDSTKVGMGFAYTNTDVDGFLRSTDVDSYTAFLYGEYKPSNWFVNGIVSYAWANYDEQKNVLGQNIGAKYDADTFGLQLMGGLDLDASGFTVTPEVGLRYYHIGTDAYTDGMGTAVSDSDEDVLTGVIGARLGKTFEVSPSMSFEPQVRLAMTYDIVDADNSSFVTLANGSSYSVEGETLDRFGIEAGVGVKAEMGDNFELSLSYEGAWRGDYQNHAGILNAKYKF